MKKILLIALLLVISGCSKTKSNSLENIDFVPVTSKISDIQNVVTLSGSIKSSNSLDVLSEYSINKSSMTVNTGDYIQEGQEIAFLTPETISTLMDSMYTSLENSIVELGKTTGETTKSQTYTTPVEGYVRNIEAKEGQSIQSVMDDKGYLAQITDSKGNVLYNIVGVNGTITTVSTALEGKRVKAGTAILYASTVSSDNSKLIDTVNTLDTNIKKLKEYKEVGLSVTAPKGGVISALGFPEQTGTEEPIVNAGEKLYTVVDPSTYYVSASLNENNYSLVSVGSSVEVNVPAVGGKFNGEISNISASAQDGSFPIEVSIENGTNLQLGMNADLRVIASSYDDLLVIPIDSVFTNVDGRKFVLLEKDTPTENIEIDPKAQLVTVGVTDGYYIQVLTGLKEGQSVLQPKMATYVTKPGEPTFTPENNEGSTGENEGGSGGIIGGDGGLPPVILG